MSYIIVFGSGFLAGWLFVKRPQWITDAIEKLRAKLGW